MSEETAKALITAERLTLYELISDQKIPVATGAEALSTIESALGSSGGGGSIDVSTLAKDATSIEINEKLPDLSSGKIPVTIAPINLTADWQLLTADITIPAGSCYVYLKVILGEVTINGITFSTNEYLNLEPSHFARHPAISIVIPAGKSVRLVRGY